MMIKKGQVLVFTNGEYDDYEIWRCARAIKSFDMRKAKQEFALLARDKVKNWSDLPIYECKEQAIANEFMIFLIDKEFIETFDVFECWCGSYGEFDTNCNKDRVF